MSNKVYYELDTEYGPLYYYTVQGWGTYAPYEFFTQTQGEFGYGTIAFGDAKFETVHTDLNGDVRANYSHKLDPYDFLMKVGPYFEKPELKEKKMAEVTEILDMKAKGIPNSKPISREPEVTKEQLNNVASKILTLYTKK